MMDILSRFKGVKKSGNGWTCRCPAHDDTANSLNIHRRRKWLLKCHAGCAVEEIAAEIGLKISDLFDEERGTQITPPTTNQLIIQRPA